jgi:hypothetical protein
VQVVVHVFIEEQLLQLGGGRGRAGRSASNACCCSWVIQRRPALPRSMRASRRSTSLDLLQNRVEQGLAPTRGARKEQCCGSRKPGRWSVGQPVHAQPGSIAGLQFDP